MIINETNIDVDLFFEVIKEYIKNRVCSKCIWLMKTSDCIISSDGLKITKKDGCVDRLSGVLKCRINEEDLVK
jgi:hypothetical protein